MIPHLSLALIMWIPRAPAPTTDIRATMARFERECLRGRGTSCETLQAELERALYQELMVMYLGGKDLDRKVLRVAARAELPELAAFGLRRLGRWNSAEDVPLAAAGLDSPYPAVRSAADELVRSLNNPQLQRLAHRSQRSGSEGSKSGLVPMEAPNPKTIGASIYPGASYSFAASRPDFAVYTTSDAPDKVLAHYAKGKRVLTGAALGDLRKQKSAKKNDEAMAAEMMQAMMSGKDPQVIVKEMMEADQAKNVDWTRGIEGVEGVQSPRYVVLEETGPQKSPSRVVAVYRDEALGATAVAFRLVPPLPRVAGLGKDGKMDTAYFQAIQELQMRRD